MKCLGIVLLSVAITICATFLLYEPISITLYKIREPYFGVPIRPDNGELVIRNDAMGDGEYGAKRRNGRFHSGIDIQAPIGTPVYAARSGIAFRGDVPTGYGRYIMIYHPDGFQSIYGHLSNWAVESTEKVVKGELVGFVGNTGNASGKYIQPHLHFEIRKAGEPQDPRDLMRK